MQAERARKSLENELGDAAARINELTVSVTVLTGEKKRMDSDIHSMQNDLDATVKARNTAEENADRLQLQVNRLVDELRQALDNFKNVDSIRKQLDVQVRELTSRLEETEAFAQRESKRIVAKLQARVRILNVIIYNEYIKSKLYMDYD